jgi:hypothetical protein
MKNRNDVMLSKDSEKKLVSYFKTVRGFKNSGKDFPVDFDDVWPLAYGLKKDALRALKKDFKEGTDYTKVGVVIKKDKQSLSKKTAPAINELRGQDLQVVDNGTFYKNAQNAIINELQNETPGAIDNEENEKGVFGRGRTSEKYCLAATCLEHFIACKVPAVFEVYRQVFHNAADLMEKSQAWLGKREEVKDIRCWFVTVLSQHGVTSEGRGYAICTDAEYKGLFNKTAKVIRKECSLRKYQPTRDAFTLGELSAVHMTEVLAGEKIEKDNCWGNEECKAATSMVASKVRAMIDDIRSSDKVVVEQKMLPENNK